MNDIRYLVAWKETNKVKNGGNSMLDIFLATFNLFFIIIDPPALVPIFLGLTKKKTPEVRRIIARQAIMIAGSLMFCFAFIGDFILASLNIHEASFRIAGGILILLIAIDMVLVNHLGFHAASDDDIEDATEKGHPMAVFPLAIPLITGPGNLTSVILTMRGVEGNTMGILMALSAMLCILVLTYVCLVKASFLDRFLGRTGANVLTRVFGIILASMAIENIFRGFNQLMATPIFHF